MQRPSGGQADEGNLLFRCLITAVIPRLAFGSRPMGPSLRPRRLLAASGAPSRMPAARKPLTAAEVGLCGGSNGFLKRMG
jgi:hypothetical protein